MSLCTKSTSVPRHLSRFLPPDLVPDEASARPIQPTHIHGRSLTLRMVATKQRYTVAAAMGVAALICVLPQAAAAAKGGGRDSPAKNDKPELNATDLPLHAGQTTITIIGSNFPRLLSSWNVTLRASGPASVPQPVATVASVARNGSKATLAVTGLRNFHAGPLLGRMNVNTRSHQFSTECVFLLTSSNLFLRTSCPPVPPHVPIPSPSLSSSFLLCCTRVNG